jgi:hypothetical protein
MMIKKIVILLLISYLIFSCTQEEGEGGLASIEGKIYGKDFNSRGNLVSEGYLAGAKVYISKHNEKAYFESMDAAFDGSFKFKFLHEGSYDIWVLGDCDYCPAWQQTYVLKTVLISNKREKVVTEDFIVTF